MESYHGWRVGDRCQWPDNEHRHAATLRWIGHLYGHTGVCAGLEFGHAGFVLISAIIPLDNRTADADVASPPTNEECVRSDTSAMKKQIAAMNAKINRLETEKAERDVIIAQLKKNLSESTAKINELTEKNENLEKNFREALSKLDGVKL
ncbi:hypothetical protein PRIPAC_94528 [Pristionchus pacificus]|uniref:Uncharacterized protein n=1 Tax=Pristionchus pacificus TaxID=54126 RepID=A0A2A6CD80_PRIPA|nr:hypothetical protein PRIPAC_94528 [Pristionchus pacificus]|eukprot:PDM76050.1 hypothetical protein PRIPAC_39654 [Pristionchus pacificus]